MQFAAHFELLKMCIHQMDWEYAELFARELRRQVDYQETMMMFNPAYPERKNAFLALQAEALSKFAEAVNLLKKCDELKTEIETGKNYRAEVAANFL